MLRHHDMLSFFFTLLAFALSCSIASAAALVTIPTLQPSLPVGGLEPNQGQAKAGILFLSPGKTSLAVTAQSVLYSPLSATLNLVASNPNPAVSFSDPLPGLVNSYTGAARVVDAAGFTNELTVSPGALLRKTNYML